MYYVPGPKLGDGDTIVNERWTGTLAFNIFKSGGKDR